MAFPLAAVSHLIISHHAQYDGGQDTGDLLALLRREKLSPLFKCGRIVTYSMGCSLRKNTIAGVDD
jgi:hypothetical protein